MADLGISISLNSTQYTQGLSQVTAQTNAAAQNINKSLNTVSNAANEGGKAMQAFTSNLGGLGSLLGGGLVVGAATLAAQAITSLVGSIIDLGKESIQIASDVQTVNRALAFTAGSAEEGAASYDRFKDVANGLGISIEKNQRAFKNFVVSATQSGQTLGQAETEFRQVATAITAMGLSAEDSNGVLLALGQIASKGTVQAEELRGQIGERLPGAFAIAARSIGVTESKLNDMLKQGEVVSKDFLPKFTAELERTFGSTAQEGIDSYSAQLNIFDNQIFELKNTLGQELIPVMIEFLKAGTDIINTFGGASNVIQFFTESLKAAAGILGGNLFKGISALQKEFLDFIGFIDLTKKALEDPIKLSFASKKEELKALEETLKQLKETVSSGNVGETLTGASAGRFFEAMQLIPKYERDISRLKLEIGKTALEPPKVAKAIKDLADAGSLGDLENQLKAINDTFQNKTGFDVAKLTGRKEDLEAQIKRLKELYGIIAAPPQVGSLDFLEKNLSNINAELRKIGNIDKNSVKLNALLGRKEDVEDEIEKLKKLLGLLKQVKLEAKKATPTAPPAIAAFQKPFGIPALSPESILQPSASLFDVQEFDVATEAILKQDGAVRGLERSLSELGQTFGATQDKSATFAAQLVDDLKGIKDNAFQSLGQGLADVAQTFGNSIGQLITGVATFEEVMKNTLLSLGQAILVELPKVVGMGLVQSAFSPVGIASFPANIPLALAGLALIGASGLIGGLLSGLGGKDDTIAAQTASAGQIGGTGTTAQATAQGLGSNSAANTQAVTNVTVVLNTNGILTAIEKQQYINGLLTGG